MNEDALLNIEKFVKAAELKDVFNSVGGVARTGFEHDELNPPMLDLPETTVDQAGEIL
jgi:hypothetical protein